MKKIKLILTTLVVLSISCTTKTKEVVFEAKLLFVSIDGCINDSIHLFYNRLPILTPYIQVVNYSNDTLFLSCKVAEYDTTTTGVFYAYKGEDTLHFYTRTSTDLYIAPFTTDTVFLQSYLPHITKVCAKDGSIACRDYLIKVAREYNIYYDNPQPDIKKPYKSILSQVINKDSTYYIELLDGDIK